MRHDSYVVYAEAVVWKLGNIEKYVSEGSIKPQRNDMPDDVFKRILEGFDISEEVEPKIRRFWKANCSPEVY